MVLFYEIHISTFPVFDGEYGNDGEKKFVYSGSMGGL